jgi:hypothetical protein
VVQEATETSQTALVEAADSYLASFHVRPARFLPMFWDLQDFLDRVMEEEPFLRVVEAGMEEDKS